MEKLLSELKIEISKISIEKADLTEDELLSLLISSIIDEEKNNGAYKE